MKFGDKVEVYEWDVTGNRVWAPGYRYVRLKYYPGVGYLHLVAIKTQLWGWMKYNYPRMCVRLQK